MLRWRSSHKRGGGGKRERNTQGELEIKGGKISWVNYKTVNYE